MRWWCTDAMWLTRWLKSTNAMPSTRGPAGGSIRLDSGRTFLEDEEEYEIIDEVSLSEAKRAGVGGYFIDDEGREDTTELLRVSATLLLVSDTDMLECLSSSVSLDFRSGIVYWSKECVVEWEDRGSGSWASWVDFVGDESEIERWDAWSVPSSSVSLKEKSCFVGDGEGLSRRTLDMMSTTSHRRSSLVASAGQTAGPNIRKVLYYVTSRKCVSESTCVESRVFAFFLQVHQHTHPTLGGLGTNLSPWSW